MTSQVEMEIDQLDHMYEILTRDALYVIRDLRNGADAFLLGGVIFVFFALGSAAAIFYVAFALGLLSDVPGYFTLFNTITIRWPVRNLFLLSSLIIVVIGVSVGYLFFLRPYRLMKDKYAELFSFLEKQT
jgi:hypothetical protein